MPTNTNSRRARINPAICFPIADLTESPEDDVTFEVEAEQDDLNPQGHFASSDAEQDRADVQAIYDRLNRGDDTAWCWIKVTATDRDGNTGESSLGGNSLEDVGHETGRACAARVREYARENGLFSEALADLNENRRTLATARTLRMCTTRYSGPTDKRGSRVFAKHITTGKRGSVSWDHALNSYENHANAAARVLGRLPEYSTSVDGGGYIFGVDPANDPATSEKS